MRTRRIGSIAFRCSCSVALATATCWSGATLTSARADEPTLVAPKPATKSETRWYTVELMGAQSGWMRTTETTTPDRITTDAELKIEIKRGSINLGIGMATTIVETPDGRGISARVVQSFGTAPLEQDYEFLPDGVKATSTQNGRATVTTLPAIKDAWLPPAAVERYVKGERAKGATSIKVRTIDPTVGIKPLNVTYEGFEPATIRAKGKDVRATKATITMEGMEGLKTVEYSDAEYNLIRTETTIGGIAVTMTESTREEALQKKDAPEVFLSTFVFPKEVIAHPRTTKHATYRLKLSQGELPDLPKTGTQNFERTDAASGTVTVRASADTVAPEKDDAPFLAGSAMVDLKDKQIVDLHARAGEHAGTTPRERAEAMRRFVHGFIDSKNLDVGFATASETARTHEGDCSEHGVLLVAMLREDGIPARAVSGLLYVDPPGSKAFFGYHMWAQALLPDARGAKHWVDLDATLPDETPYDATHIALATSALADGDLVNSLATMAPILGRLEITVEKSE